MVIEEPDDRLNDIRLTDRQRELLDVFLEAWDRKSPEERKAIIRDTLSRIRQSYGLDDEQPR